MAVAERRSREEHQPVMSRLAQEILSLVQTPSVTGHETALAGLLQQRLGGKAVARGNRLTRVHDSLILRPEPRRPDRPLLVLAGHIDTVPIGDALDPELVDGVVIGRGASDMKSGIAVMLALVEELDAAEGFADRAFVFYAGEEGSARGNDLPRVFQAEPWIKEAGLAIVLEPTSNHLELGCNGSVHILVTFHGRACHSARPWQGRHPMLEAIPWLTETLRHPIRVAEVEGVVYREVVTITTIHAGEARNVVPATLQVNLNLRYAPDRTPEEAEQLALSLCPHPGDPPGEAPRVTCSPMDHSPAGRIDQSAPLYRHVLEATGLPRRGKQGWTDVARFTAAGVPALNWGPGDPEFAHTRHEQVSVAEAEACLEAMRAYLLGPGPDRSTLTGGNASAVGESRQFQGQHGAGVTDRTTRSESTAGEAAGLDPSPDAGR